MSFHWSGSVDRQTKVEQFSVSTKRLYKKWISLTIPDKGHYKEIHAWAPGEIHNEGHSETDIWHVVYLLAVGDGLALSQQASLMHLEILSSNDQVPTDDCWLLTCLPPIKSCNEDNIFGKNSRLK